MTACVVVKLQHKNIIIESIKRMKQYDKTTDVNQCIHCGKCTQVCLFLEKYGLDISNIDKINELAYHCFLCGNCSRVCPQGIDGREVILNLRRRQVKENQGKLKENGYTMLVAEKGDYKFRNYKNVTTKSILFPGCNFPSYFPESTRYLCGLLKEKFGIGVVFDCCGKPIAELGLVKEEERIITEISRRLQRAGVQEVITLCPNCYAFLKPRLPVAVVSIYEKMSEWGMGSKIREDISVFPPCPDRKTGELLEQIKEFVEGEITILGGQCCGLGGCASRKEPDLAETMLARINKQGKVHTYCASCSGNFSKKGYENTEHLLLRILGLTETPDTKKSMLNRMKTRYFREGQNE